MTHPLDGMTQCVAFDDLLRPVAVDDGLEAVEGPAAHHVPHALLLDPETLDLEKRIAIRFLLGAGDQK